VEPDGPAAKVGLTVGDVIVAVDGHDVRGRRSYLYETLLTAPEGTLIEFELERGETIAIEAGEAPKVKVFL
jgi:C-terminal processing protease CtpA/Prc